MKVKETGTWPIGAMFGLSTLYATWLCLIEFGCRTKSNTIYWIEFNLFANLTHTRFGIQFCLIAERSICYAGIAGLSTPDFEPYLPGLQINVWNLPDNRRSLLFLNMNCFIWHIRWSESTGMTSMRRALWRHLSPSWLPIIFSIFEDVGGWQPWIEWIVTLS